MTPFKDYKKYYLRYISRTLGLREQEFDCMDISNNERSLFYNYVAATKILLMVSFIEANFLNKKQLKKLRNFEKIDSLPEKINPTQMSCFIYIRDCIAHNPNIKIMSEGKNTSGFIQAVKDGQFNFATIENNNIKILETSIHHLHLTIRKFYDLPTTLT